MTSADLIARARARSLSNDVGVRTKVRFSRELYSRAAVCAAEVGEPLGRWLALSCRAGNIERHEREQVSASDSLCSAGADSVVATVDGVYQDHGAVRRAVALAVGYCEARRPPAFRTDLREGVDYVVEVCE